ncbi:DMT family transporter [Kibdelosporangium philippinense]|uniref:DMT family transporter n=1 Tax=Kibdelosporangium philippinense TaxID=211113 RepID=A0ABS8ZZ75_9PSEU|nr:EamA family transporter [Kibdelosporangium philippinense]MCE7011577.1 DMT family transporter [Kibdelosporangium philippinense]
MDLVAVGLVLFAAIAHAGWNFSAKRAGTGGPLFVWLYQSASAVIWLPVAGIALLGEPPQWHWLLASGVSAVLHVAYGLALQKGYAAGDMSVVYPVARGSGPLLSVVAAVAFLNERPGHLALVGAAVVVAGVFVVGLGKKHVSVGPSLFYGGLTGVTIASYTLWDALSVQTVPPLIYSATGAVIQSLLMAPYAARNSGRIGPLWREHKVDVLVIAVLSPAAYIAVLYAMRIAPVSMVAPARELSIVFGSFIAWRWLREPNPVQRLAGALVVLTGVVLIAVS